MLDSSSLISVQGQGCVKVMPDVMRLEIGMVAYFKSYDEAYAQSNANSEWIKRILQENDLRPDLARTVDFDLKELSEPFNGEEGYGSLNHEHLSYKMKQSIRLDLPINKELISSIVRAVGENIQGVRIEIGFTQRDIQALQLKLLEKAVSDAGVKAKVMAEAAGCQLGKVAHITYRTEKPSVYYHARTIHSNEEAKASTASALDIEPADFTVADTVEVTWHLK